MESNVQKMREACQKILDLLMLRGDGKSYCILTWDEFNESQKMLRRVLSEPIRNCDRFNNEMELQFAFLAELLSMGINGASLEEYSKWLLAEAKGASNESKQNKEKKCGNCKHWKRDKSEPVVGTCPNQECMSAEWAIGCQFYEQKEKAQMPYEEGDKQ